MTTSILQIKKKWFFLTCIENNKVQTNRKSKIVNLLT